MDLVEDDAHFDESFANILFVPLTDSAEFLISSLTVTVESTIENGCTKKSHAISHSITAASKKRVAQITAAIAECIGLLG